MWTLGGSRLTRYIHHFWKCEHAQNDVNNGNVPGKAVSEAATSAAAAAGSRASAYSSTLADALI